jgi:superfamily II DNA or RNA helicase
MNGSVARTKEDDLMTTVRIAKNAVVAKLIDPPREVKSFVTSLLSYEVDGGAGWSGKSSFYNVGTNTFPAGFAYLAQQELTAIGHSVQMITKPHDQPLGPGSPIVDSFGNDDPRYDYQMHALRQVEKHGAGIIRVATGGGKSRIMKLIMARYRRMTLFLTTRGILLYQMDAQLKEIGLNTGQIGDGEMRAVRGINLGMVQTLVQALEEPSYDRERRAVIQSINTAKNKDPNLSEDKIAEIARAAFDRKTKKRNVIIQFLNMIEVVIGEEAHEAGGTSYYEILRHCRNATIRVALTATPFMRSSAADNMRLMAAFGPVLVDIPESLLIDRGILAKPYFKLVDVAPHPKLCKTSPFERAFTLGYIENSFMLEALVKDALRAKTLKLPVLCLVARKKHGDAILAGYNAAGIRAVFLRGETDMKERRARIADLIAGEIDVVIGTTILDVGVDVPAIGLVQLAGGMKAEVALRQRVGRGLRAKKAPLPNIAFIADYSCNVNSYLRDHARQREGILRATPGFVEGILATGEDFPWELFS